MDNRDKARFSPPALGGVSLLAAFAILCLTVFALLSLSTVQADRRLADASAQAVADYYAADCQAQQILARLRQGEIPQGVERDGQIYRYVAPISQTQQLSVAVRLEGGEYEILEWRAGAAGQWQADDSLDLWDGETDAWQGD